MQADQQQALLPHYSREERCVKVAFERVREGGSEGGSAASMWPLSGGGGVGGDWRQGGREPAGSQASGQERVSSSSCS